MDHTEKGKWDTLENAYYKLSVVSMAFGRLGDPQYKLSRQEATGLNIITREVISVLERYVCKEEGEADKPIAPPNPQPGSPFTD